LEATAVDVGAWLRELGLEQYEAAFRANDVNAAVLPALTADDLKEMGIASIGHRRRLLEAIAALRFDAMSAEAPTQVPPAAPPDLTGLPGASETAAERRPLSVMFCDLIGSTALSSRLDPEDLREIIHAYQNCVATTIQKFNGFIARYVGDGVLIYFGWPQAHESDAERAVRAGLAVTAAVSEKIVGGQRLQVRIGIATGLVVIGEPIGSGDSRQQTAIGETPNLAARLQAFAAPDSVVVDDITRRMMGTLFDWADLGELRLAGLPHPVRAWQALREGVVVSRFKALHGAEMRLPLIGREEELDLLLRRWRLALAGDGQAVLVGGEAGIGKSHLITVLQDGLRQEEHATLFLSCSQDYRDSALNPVIAHLRRSAGFARGDTAEALWHKLRGALPADSLGAEDVGLIASLLSLPETPDLPMHDMSPQRRKKKSFEALLRMIEGYARQRPLLLLIEDAHWADPSTLDLLDIIIERLPQLRCLIVITHRTEFIPPWAGMAGVTTLLLPRLTQAQSAELVSLIDSQDALPHGLVTRITARADGVPLFIEELTKVMVERGQIEAGNVAPGIPVSLQASLTARLDRHPRARQVAQLGAVIGRSFPHDLITCLSELVPAELEESLEQLVSAGLISRRGLSPEALYTFGHVLFQEAAYESLLKSRRRVLHRQLLRLLEERRPELAEEMPETLARHAALAGEVITAARYLLRAGQRAMRSYALAEAEAHFTTGLELLGGEPDDDERKLLRLDLQTALRQCRYRPRFRSGQRAFGGHRRPRENIPGPARPVYVPPDRRAPGTRAGHR
jgi:class 3 adenylate cyclase